MGITGIRWNPEFDKVLSNINPIGYFVRLIIGTILLIYYIPY